MLTKKFRVFAMGGGAAFLVMAGAGCAPPGPQALLDGKRLLDKGQPAAAAIRLEEAARVMPTNSLVWSYLAVARHYSGSLSNAEVAYLEALRLNPDLVESRFGLGMLYWQQNQWADAREQFASVTVLRPEHTQAWLRLGECQVRLNDVRGALMSLSRAVTLDARSPEAWNWLGVAQVQSKQWRDAEESFGKALQLQMNHGPALLNLAILNEQHLDRPRDALDLYRQYIAFWPAAANCDEVRSAAALIERRLAPPPPPSASIPTPRQPAVAQVPDSRPVPSTQFTNQVAPASSKPAAMTPTQAVVSADPQRVPTPPGPSAKPVEKSAPVPQATGSPSVSAETPEPTRTPPKRGLFARLNPLNLIKGSPEEATASSSGVEANAGVANRETPSARSVSIITPPGIPPGTQYRRYPYRVAPATARGNQDEARRLALEATRFRLTGRLSESAAKCREALRLEPASYEAEFNLGLVLLQSGDTAGALAAFENAVLLDPNSEAARYNFGLMLKQEGYPVDAALEMHRLLEGNSEDVRAHLMLGNLYDHPLGNKTRAREHYLRVLELAPGHPEAGAIRFWLKQNPV